MNGDSRITRFEDYRAKAWTGSAPPSSFPIYNEEIARVYEGLRATFESLEKTGQLERFDFFILSDSTDPDKWVDEERHWFKLVRDLDALGRIYYRRRANNEAKKSGNVRDFLNSWGRRYRYFVVFDADSVMRGETVVDLVKLMEAHPETGLIQTVPALVEAESLFGRMQQFANRLYAPVFIAGLDYWAQGFGNYWGHNAIIRTEAFMQCCDLPQLPGRKPFGGQILSHDFVEAALLLKEHWQVWFACDLEGSYEEGPQTMIDNATRDRRWCQGNLQHTMVILARGLRGVSRIHLAMGIMGYLASPLWLLFLLTFNWMLWYKNYTGLSDITVRNFTPFIHLSGTEHAFLIFVICMAVLFLPKVLALVDLALDRPRIRVPLAAWPTPRWARWPKPPSPRSRLPSRCSGTRTLSSRRFLAWTLHGGRRKESLPALAGRNRCNASVCTPLIGLVWGWAIWRLDHPTFWWFAPVMAGMVLSIPLSVITSRASWGGRAQAIGPLLDSRRNAAAARTGRIARPHGGVARRRRDGASSAGYRPGRGDFGSLRQRLARLVAPGKPAQSQLCQSAGGNGRGRAGGAAPARTPAGRRPGKIGASRKTSHPLRCGIIALAAPASLAPPGRNAGSVVADRRAPIRALAPSYSAMRSPKT